MTADEIIAALDLQPHPEGGFYRETFRDYAGPDGRARSTAIYYLLRAGEVIPVRREAGHEAFDLREGGFQKIAISAVHRETEAPHFETLLAVGLK